MAALTGYQRADEKKKKKKHLVHLRALSHFNTQKKYFFQ